MISLLRRTVVHCFLLTVVLLLVGRVSTGMDFVRISPDKKGFVLDRSNDRYVPWDHNYGSVDLMERLASWTSAAA